MSLRRIAVKAVAVATTATVLFTGQASAATQFPSSDKNGIRLDWSGQWESLQRVEDITLQVCDANPADKNKATVQLQAWVTQNGASKPKTAPSVFQVPIGDKACKE